MKKLLFSISYILLLFALVGCSTNDGSSAHMTEKESGNKNVLASPIPSAISPTIPPTIQPTEANEDAVENTESPTKAPEKKAHKKGKKQKEHKDTDLVKVADFIPDIKEELRYATKNNFTGKKIYDFNQAYLRYGTVKKLAKAQEKLKKMGYSLLIWDAYRPVSAQFRLWEICPDSTYIANPNTGYSSHSRGNTVDITMVSLDVGDDKVIMPTDFDDFSLKADRDYSDCSEEERKHAEILEKTMSSVGFKPYSAEWWHFSDIYGYPVIDQTVSELK